MTALFECTDLTGGRGSLTAFRHVDLAIDSGKVLALLGPNGAGKTTLMLTLAGLLPAQGGTVRVNGNVLRSGRAAQANRAGVVLVPDNRSLFPTLTVEENVRVACRKNGPTPRSMLELFPGLQMRWKLKASVLSGGEQQMVAIARALIQEPKVLLIDELSMGLAPLVVRSLLGAVRTIADDRGCAVVLVEQHVGLALEVADSAAFISRGSVVFDGPANELVGQADRLQQVYFGDGQA